MAAIPSLTVLPGYPETPTSVEIDCSGLDDTKEIEFLIDDEVRGTIPVGVSGDAVLSFLVSGGDKVKVSDLIFGSGSIGNVPGSTLVRVSDGSHSMELRYKA